jgi:hypothetical protein
MGEAGSAGRANTSKFTLTYGEQRAACRRWQIRLVNKMKRALRNLLWLFFCLTALGRAQAVPSALGSAGRGQHFVSTGDSLPSAAPGVSPPVLAAPAALPRMAPELALQAFEGRSRLQAEQLASYSATMLICAQLPTHLAVW